MNRDFASRLLSERFWLTAYAALGAGLFVPESLAPSRHAIPVLLAGVLFFTCLKVELSAIGTEVFTRGRLTRLLAFIGIKLIALPLLAFAMALVIAPAWSLGVLLVALMPAGMSSAAFADVHRGNVAQALLVLLGSSLLCPLTIPLFMLLGQRVAGGDAHFDVTALAERVLYIALMLVIPFAAAQLVRRRAPGWVVRHSPRFTPFALLFLAAMIFCSTATTRDQWFSRGLVALFAPLLIVSLVMLTALALGKLFSFFVSREDAVAFTCSTVYPNNGLSIAFALAFFAGQGPVLLPCVLMTIPMIWGVSVVGRVIPVVK